MCKSLVFTQILILSLCHLDLSIYFTVVLGWNQDLPSPFHYLEHSRQTGSSTMRVMIAFNYILFFSFIKLLYLWFVFFFSKGVGLQPSTLSVLLNNTDLPKVPHPLLCTPLSYNIFNTDSHSHPLNSLPNFHFLSNSLQSSFLNWSGQHHTSFILPLRIIHTILQTIYFNNSIQILTHPPSEQLSTLMHPFTLRFLSTHTNTFSLFSTSS